MSKPWPLVPLGGVLQLQRRWIKLEPDQLYTEIGVRSFGKGIFHKSPVTGLSLGNKRVLRICPGDLVFNNVFAWEGAVGVASEADEGTIGSHRFVTYTVKDNQADAHFLRLFFRTEAGLQVMRQVSPGSAGRNRTLNLDQFAQQRIPLPPLLEQQRIVAKVEELAIKSEEAQRLRATSASHRAAVLPSARNEVFTRLRESIWPLRLDSVADSRLGKMLSGNLADGVNGTPYLRNANVQWDRLDLSSIHRMHVSAEERDDFALLPGDVLVCEGGDVGKAAIWHGEVEGCIFQKAIHRVRVDQDRVSSSIHAASYCLGADQGHFAELTTQTTIAHLTGVKLKSYGVIVPDRLEQRHVVAHLDELAAKVDSLKALQAQSAAELDALLPSILDKAFKGEL